MKIFYAVQATGNGHISRAKEILPYLAKHGDVDIFLSGTNFALETDFPVAFRSRGLSFSYDKKTGGIDLLKTLSSISCRRLWREARDLPVEKYDLVINDFEAITSFACKIKNVPSVHFGHQASFLSNLVPRPKTRNLLGEFILSHYASGTNTIGLHFKKYDHFIWPPIIKQKVIEAEPIDSGHITVYLSQYDTDFLINIFSSIKNFSFHIFSTTNKEISRIRNIKIFPINNEMFTESMITCHGLITGAGFETPSEALYMHKKLMVIPVKGQYEQSCNAAALVNDFKVTHIPVIDSFFVESFYNWVYGEKPLMLKIQETNEDIVSELFTQNGKC